MACLCISGYDTKLQLESGNEDLNSIANWFKVNGLWLNIAKTNYILFRKKNADTIITKTYP